MCWDGAGERGRQGAGQLSVRPAPRELSMKLVRMHAAPLRMHAAGCRVLMRGEKHAAWKLYMYLDVNFHVYEMNNPIGKANKLPIHFKQGSNEKASIKYEKYDDF